MFRGRHLGGYEHREADSLNCGNEQKSSINSSDLQVRQLVPRPQVTESDETLADTYFEIFPQSNTYKHDFGNGERVNELDYAVAGEICADTEPGTCSNVTKMLALNENPANGKENLF